LKRFRGVFVAVVAAVSLVVSGFVPVYGAELGPVAPFEAADLLSARVQASLICPTNIGQFLCRYRQDTDKENTNAESFF
jgi:hypothetical protein